MLDFYILDCYMPERYRLGWSCPAGHFDTKISFPASKMAEIWPNCSTQPKPNRAKPSWAEMALT